MSYVTQHRSTGSGRIAIIATVAGLHVAVGWALVNGLGIDYIKTEVFNMPSKSIPSEPAPPPEPTPEPPQAREVNPAEQRPVAVRDPLIKVPAEGPVFKVPDLVPHGPVELPDFGPVELPNVPTPTPSFAPVGAAPRGNTGGWITPADYPTRDIRNGNEGTVRYLLSLDARGSVTGCRITGGSGHEGLDRATCSLLVKRARFTPATDSSGKTVAGTFAGSIKWVIPN